MRGADGTLLVMGQAAIEAAIEASQIGRQTGRLAMLTRFKSKPWCTKSVARDFKLFGAGITLSVVLFFKPRARACACR